MTENVKPTVSTGTFLRFLLPLGVFLGLVFFLWRGLALDPKEVPSPLIDKPAPDFSLNQLQDPQKVFARKDMDGKVWLLNVWASWCETCREEHPLLLELARMDVVPIVGLNYKDERAAGIDTLSKLGDPYKLSAFDNEGKVGIDFGVYAVPESFLIDKHGVIRYKRIGAITPDVLSKELLPKIQELNRG
ncbi:MAG TPA: DsbE family thiol:disulfide interchange protein [Burkholderiaceae bacterium]|jgi:cytochrome c biogenesis protein CcmG/thiol:disulfide interchange protein DsbE